MNTLSGLRPRPRGGSLLVTRTKGNLRLVAPFEGTTVSRTSASWQASVSVAPLAVTHGSSLLERVRERKICQWTLSYLAVAWALLQLLDVLSDIWGLSGGLQRLVSATLGLATFPVLVVAWYHGERGRQQVCKTEAIVLATLIVFSTMLLWTLARAPWSS